VPRNFQTVSISTSSSSDTYVARYGSVNCTRRVRMYILGAEVCWKDRLWEPYSPFCRHCNYVLCADRERGKSSRHALPETEITHLCSQTVLMWRHSFTLIHVLLMSWCLNTISSENSTRAGSDNYVTGKILCVCVCVCVCGSGGTSGVFAFEVCTDIPTSLCVRKHYWNWYSHTFSFAFVFLGFLLTWFKMRTCWGDFTIRQYERVAWNQVRRVGWIFQNSFSIQDYFIETAEMFHI
jgi:hypothetical protein